ncbi:MAG: hypothetical protein IID44_27300 [Planctomycetes bacterium]|nr:hypothetical protein [Planctomycetota bacterium]
MARYRAGDWQGSIDDLEQAANDACGWSFLAMAHWQLDNKQQARQWHERAVAWLQQNQPKQPAFRRFCVESAELLGVDPPPGRTQQKPKVFTDPMIFAWSAWEDPR